jgi:cytosolic carboxypeptidase protein 2/3
MKGIIDFVTSIDSPEAILLRKNFVFKLIPMINPDGVVWGNYRCSISGMDLNRKWKNPDGVLFPEITSIKKLVAEF